MGRFLLIFTGSVSMVLGIIGIFVPLLPTTPFLLLSAACYARSSQRLYEWLLSQKHLGTYIRNFQEKKVIPLKVKVFSLLWLWLAMAVNIFFIVKNVYWQVGLGVLALAISIHILSYKNAPNKSAGK